MMDSEISNGGNGAPRGGANVIAENVNIVKEWRDTILPIIQGVREGSLHAQTKYSL